jgi:cytochrome c biogenesis protein CcmG/thiol:disulfide interchange protein DsbE
MGRIAIVVGFFALVILLAVGLKRDPREVPSPLIGKPAPAFELPRLAGSERFSPAEMRGKVWLLNVWASWCVTCRDEHPVLVDFAAPSACRSSGSTTRTSATTR